VDGTSSALYPLAVLGVLSTVTFIVVRWENKIKHQEHEQILLKIQKLWRQQHSDINTIDDCSCKLADNFVLTSLKKINEKS